MCVASVAAETDGTDAFKSYTLKSKPAAELARTLGQLLGNDVEVVVDDRTNRLLVRGNDASQRLAQRLIASLDQAGSNPLAQPVPAATVVPVANQAPPRPNEMFVPTPWRGTQWEPALGKLFGTRLRRQGRGDRLGYTVTDKSGAIVNLMIDESRGGVLVVGAEPLMSQTARLLKAQAGSQQKSNVTIRTVSVHKSDPNKIREAVDAYRRGHATSTPAAGSKGVDPNGANPLRGEGPQLAQVGPDLAPPPAGAAAMPEAADGTADQTRERLRELGLDLDIETLPDLDAIILRGSNRDVNEVLRIIEDIERLSAETIPTIEVYPLKNVNGDALAPMLTLIQKDLLLGRPGRVSITALNTPNSLLLVGWGDAINTVKELIEKLDQPVEPQTQLRVFRLRHAPAATATTTVQEFFGKRTGLGPKVLVTADVRSNSLIVQAAPRDMSEVELLIKRIDTGRSESVNQVRVFKLRNSLAGTLATTLQSAMDSQRAGQGAAAGGKSSILELLTLDPQGEKIVKSGILADVKITPDTRANSLIVSAPAESMELIAALISQMDDAPVAVSQIKVFHVVNGDAAGLVQMLRSLLPATTTGGTATTLARAEGETSFAPLRYSVEPRTNSIIATGSAGDLAIIEALLMRLDEKDVLQRKNTVYQLKNAPALDVAEAINQFLRNERQVQQAAPGQLSPFQQIEQEVIVVPEPVGNLLIISASPRYYDEIYKMVEKIDAQPPQVLIQVLIAEVSLNDTTEFGIEWGLQDGALFDRSLLGGLVTTTNTTTFGNPPTTVQQQKIQAATNTPGFDFNSAQTGNSGSETSLATAAHTAAQGLANFAVGRSDPALGFGGLVLSASSKSINVLLRALQQNQRLEVLSRPQVMTIDNQPAFIQVGQKVPRITGVTINQIGQNNTVMLENVGLILGVTPRISPDGMVVMEIDAEKSDVGTDADGIPISVSASGAVIRSPRINVTTAQTTISTASGETIILGGLITKSLLTINRRVPYISDIPVLGQLFKYDQVQAKRTELLIILTPHVVRNAEDAERLKQIEAARMHWCAADVHSVHGDPEFCRRGQCPACNADMPVIYPDLDPAGAQPRVIIPPETEGLEAKKGTPTRAARLPEKTQTPTSAVGVQASNAGQTPAATDRGSIQQAAWQRGTAPNQGVVTAGSPPSGSQGAAISATSTSYQGR